VTNIQESFVKQYTFHINPTNDEEHVLMTTTQKEIPAITAAVTKINMEDKSQENSAANKTNGSPRSSPPGTKPAVRGIEDIWKEPSTTGPTQHGAFQRHNGILLQ
jgi:hypothetical protein